MSDFNQRNVLITGAASGIGKLMAQKSAALGANLILWDVNAKGLDQTAAELRNTGAKVTTYVCNLTDRAAIAETGKRVLSECGPVDILINNAGIVSGKVLTEISDEEIERTFQVNTLALFWTSRAFLPEMMRRKSGHIVTIASAGGIVGTSKMVDYCSSKFAAIGFDESLRLELKRLKSPVRTTVICPFYIDTGYVRGRKNALSVDSADPQTGICCQTDYRRHSRQPAAIGDAAICHVCIHGSGVAAERF
ncbi:MAG: SDR family oxidoreductase [Calditrichia bacterium]